MAGGCTYDMVLEIRFSQLGSSQFKPLSVSNKQVGASSNRSHVPTLITLASSLMSLSGPREFGTMADRGSETQDGISSSSLASLAAWQRREVRCGRRWYHSLEQPCR